MKTCPFCAEEIQQDAIKCRYCHEFLDGRAPASPPAEELPFVYRRPVLLGAIVLIGPLVLPLIWTHPRMDRREKAVWTAGMSLVVVAVCGGMYWSVSGLWSLYSELQRVRAQVGMH